MKKGPTPVGAGPQTYLVFLLRVYLERIDTRAVRLGTHSKLPIVRYLPIVRRHFGYLYSARRTDGAMIGRARISNPGITGHPVAKGYYAAAGHCGCEMEPERRGRSAASGKHMSGRCSGGQWAGRVSLPGDLDDITGYRTSCVSHHDCLLIVRHESVDKRVSD